MGISRWLRKLTASQNDLDVLRAIDEAVPSSIEDLAEDTSARIIGIVEPLDGRLDGRRVKAPISHRQVLCWGYSITSMDVQTRRTEGVPFAIAANGHRAVIELENARLLITATKFAKCRGVGSTLALQPLLLAAGATDPEDKLFYASWERSRPATYRFSEWVIEPGMVLAVVGRGVREPDPAGGGEGYRERQSWIRITGSPEHQVAITDEIEPDQL